MDQDLAHWHEEFNNERRRQIYRLIITRRHIRDTCNAFDVTEEAFTASYRLTRDLAFSVIELIRPFMRRTVSALAVPLHLQFLCALYFYANGSYQMPVGRNHDISIAQPTVCKFIESVTDALNRPEVVGRLIKFPRTQQEVDDTIERNRLMGGRLPNTLGYTDGSLIKIKKPSVDQNRRAFIGRKNFASVNVLFTCDRRLYIQNVVARHPGSTHDSHIFALSALRDQMIHINTNIRNCVLIGDSGFALEPWLIVPFARGDEPEEDTPEARFNKALCFDRCHIERAIGCMKERFRAINNERVLHYDPVKACRIVIAITVLHNLCILARVPQYVAQNANNPVVNDENDHVAAEDDILARGRLVRNQMVQQLERMR